MTVLWPIAMITFKEGIRNRAIYGISLFALLLLVANLLVSGMMFQSAGKAAVDIALSAVSFSGLLLVLFVGINLIAKDLDRRTIYMVLARPISRAQYIIGKFFGMVLLIAFAMVVLSVLAMAWDDEASNLRRMSAVSSRCRLGIAIVFSLSRNSDTLS